jgi:hypothetical protein
MSLTKLPVTNRPDRRHVELNAKAKDAKSQVLKLAGDLKNHDQTKADNWPLEDEVMITGQDHHRNFLQRLFGYGETVSGQAEFQNDQVETMKATLQEEAFAPIGTRQFHYEKLEGGDEIYVAPNNVETWVRREEVGRSKTSTYYQDYQMYDVTYTAVRENADGTLFVDDTATSPSESLGRLRDA